MRHGVIFFKRFVHWLLLVLTVVYLLTGLGITQYQTVEPATLGLLSKNLSFKIHDSLLLPFMVVLILHVIVSLVNARAKQEN
jgi:hypothetical protein